MSSVTINVVGRPIPQGSHTAIIVWSGGKQGVGTPRAVIVDARDSRSRKLFKEWRATIKAAANARHTGPPIPNPVRVGIVFRLHRGKTVTRAVPSTTPDVDKLARAVLDSLTGSVIKDDAQVVKLIAEKRYCRPGEPEGALVVVSLLDTSPNPR